jgi:hypothetical protein
VHSLRRLSSVLTTISSAANKDSNRLSSGGSGSGSGSGSERSGEPKRENSSNNDFGDFEILQSEIKDLIVLIKQAVAELESSTDSFSIDDSQVRLCFVFCVLCCFFFFLFFLVVDDFLNCLDMVYNARKQNTKFNANNLFFSAFFFFSHPDLNCCKSFQRNEIQTPLLPAVIRCTFQSKIQKSRCLLLLWFGYLAR